MPPNETLREPIVTLAVRAARSPVIKGVRSPKKPSIKCSQTQDREKLQHYRAALLEQLAVQADNTQRGERLHLECNDDQPLENPDDRIKQRRYVNVPQENHPDEVTQIDVSKDVRERRRR